MAEESVRLSKGRPGPYMLRGRDPEPNDVMDCVFVCNKQTRIGQMDPRIFSILPKKLVAMETAFAVIKTRDYMLLYR